MFKTNKLINIFFMSAITLVMSACVPKASEKKAICGTNQAFNSVSRTCVSTSELRTRPVATKSSDTLSQEVAKTITLSYSDGNNNSAIACNVTSVSANIEAISPQVINRGVFNKADLVSASADSLALAVPVNGTTPAYRTAMLAALASAKKTYNYSNVILQLGLFKTAVDNILAYSAPLVAGNASVMNYYNLTQTRLLDYLPLKTLVDNRCDCTGGICTTTIAPRIFQNGTAGFTYTISDIDGEGDPKIVNLSIAAMSSSTSFLRAVVKSDYLIFPESATSTATSNNLTLPAATDYLGTATTAFTYTFSGSRDGSNYGLTTNGKVSNCMDLTGSSGSTDKTCTYTPNSGDAFDITAPAIAAVTIDDLVFTAKKAGTYANNITIQYFDLQTNNLAIDSHVTASESFGLVSQSYSDTFVRVVGDSIKVFINPSITTTTDIAGLINNDVLAKALVTVTGGTLSTFPVATAATSLVGGSDAYDKISYTVNNGFGSSTNTASVIIKITATEDAPVFNSVAATTVTALEDSGQITINLSPTYTDAENNVDACNVDPLDAIFLGNFTVNSCLCAANVCTLKITANASVSSTSPFTLNYRVGSVGLYTAYKAYSVNITPVNDAPTMNAIGVQTIPENSSAAPSSGYVDVTVDPGGGGFETSQILSMTATSSVPALVPNTICTNYTPGAGTPIAVVTPAAAGVYYYDTTNQKCYVSTGTTSALWSLYPSLTVMPKCVYESFGPGAPSASVTPTAAGKRYLDTTNNKCYRSTAATSGSWIADDLLTDFYMAYTPIANQSGSTSVALSLTDDGGTTNAGVNNAAQTFTLNVTSVDDPPYFISTITKVETNEGGQVISDGFIVDEDQGSSADEDIQDITITSITSDNSSVLPVSAIKIFYDLNDNGVEDSLEARAIGAALDPGGIDSKLHKFYLKFNPVAGVSGNSNIVLTVNDGNVAASHFVTTSFSFIVHPIAALHGGWANISAKGIKTDKNGAPAADADVQCNYNKSTDAKACDTNQNCTGTDSPNALITPDRANVLYWDSANHKCYRSAAADKFSWLEFKTSCPVSRATGLCSGENCVATSNPTPTAVGQYYYNTSSNICYISTGLTSGNWSVFVPSKINLSWNSFTVTGSGSYSSVQILGWNVYRREAGFDYDFKSGFLKTNTADTMSVSDSTLKTFTDTTAVAGKVYYYLVRPVENTIRQLTVSTPEIFSEVRIFAPKENYAFVHRWMANQEVCNSMHMTTSTTNKVDPTHNYRCPYKGPGESVANPGFYDIEKDMLVDISETGCPYTVAPACTANGCIGIGSPTSLGLSSSLNDIYYDRNSGVCYINSDGLSSWVSYTGASGAQILAASAKVNTVINPPLSNISQAQADVVCSVRDITTAKGSLVGVGAARLPSKKEFIAYAAGPVGMSDAVLTDLEQGFSLNVQSRCNSTNANGLEIAYTDSSIPSTSYIYSIPGTSSSGIRSLYTGSVPWVNDYSTETCSSRYGIQDVYGNVAEWVKDKMTCSGAAASASTTTLTSATAISGGSFSLPVASTAGFPSTGFVVVGSGGGAEILTYTAKASLTAFTVNSATLTHASAETVSLILAANNYVCSTNSGTDLGNYDINNGVYNAAATDRYKFDLSTGPYNDIDASSSPSSGDGFLTNWTFRDELFGAGKFSFPVGMPINIDIATKFPLAPTLTSFLDIGPTAGITSSQLHEDGIIVNGAATNNIFTVNDLGNPNHYLPNPTQQGSFVQGGSYLSGNRSGRYSSELVPDATVGPDIGFRCYIPIDTANFPADVGRHIYSY
ncbi:MAG: hypothetical protein PHY93_07535 [Bacteriovorax sp.]|nr:hypothetical protein [Bacteriovorax sp.]